MVEPVFFQSALFKSSIEKLITWESALPQPVEPLSTKQTLNYIWQMGKEIYGLKREAPRGEKDLVIGEVAKFLLKKERYLSSLQQFFTTFPKGVPTIKNINRLKWTHFTIALTVPTKPAMLYYLREAAEENMATRDLQVAIRNHLYELSQQASSDHPYGVLTRETRFLYNYTARVVEVIDGDTLRLVAEQGFDSQHKLRVRLRGINTPELKGPRRKAGLKAKKMVESYLLKLEFVVIASYKIDSFGRYVVDVFFHPVYKDPNKVFQKGFFLNQMLLDQGLAKLAVY